MVTYELVARAAEQLKERGDSVTLDSVRKMLGGGSFTSLSPLVRRWRDAATAVAQQEAAMNDDAQQLAQQLYSIAHAAGKAAAAQQLEQLQAALKQERDAAQAVEREAQDVAKQLEAVRAELEQERRAAAKLEKDKMQAAAQLEVLKVERDAAKAELERTRADFDKAQEQISKAQEQISKLIERRSVRTAKAAKK